MRHMDDFMLQHDGVRVSLDEADNNHIELHRIPVLSHWARDSQRHVVRRAIHVTPERVIKINVKFGADFDLYGASGVCVTIGVGGRAYEQFYWIDEENLRHGHAFDTVTMWRHGKDEGAVAERTRIRAPVPDAEAEKGMRPYSSMLQSGCIIVRLTRGHILGSSRDSRLSYPTEPPYAHLHKETSMPKLICWHWFEPVVGEFAPEIVFEIRNVVTLDVQERPGETYSDLTRSARGSCGGRSIASTADDGAMTMAIRKSLEDTPRSSRADSLQGNFKPESHGLPTATPQTQTTRSDRGRKRRLTHDTTGSPRATGDAKLSGKSCSTKPFVDCSPTKKVRKCDEDDDDDEVQPRIKQEPIESSVNSFDEKAQGKTKEEKQASSTLPMSPSMCPLPGTLDDLRFELLESEVREQVLQQRLRQILIRRKMQAMQQHGTSTTE